MGLLDQLADIYYTHENWHTERLDRIELAKHHERKMALGELITVSDGELLVGYCEFSHRKGVCFVENLFVKEGYRRGKAIWQMYRRLKEITKGCRIYCGERNKNSTKYPEMQIRSDYGKQ